MWVHSKAQGTLFNTDHFLGLTMDRTEFEVDERGSVKGLPEPIPADAPTFRLLAISGEGQAIALEFSKDEKEISDLYKQMAEIMTKVVYLPAMQQRPNPGGLALPAGMDASKLRQ